MLHSIENEMGMRTRNNRVSTMSTSGIGDTQVGIMYAATGKLTASLAVSLPTGSIDEETSMVMMTGIKQTMRAPYGMQLGTGTLDLLPSVTYKKQLSKSLWTTQASYRLHTGENDEGYTWVIK